MAPLYPERSAVFLRVGKSRDWGLGREDSKDNVPRLPPTRSCCSALGLRLQILTQSVEEVCLPCLWRATSSAELWKISAGERVEI